MDFESLSNLLKQFQKEESIGNLFQKITQKELSSKNIPLYSQINSSTVKISSYFDSAINKFPSLFENNLSNFEDSLKYLKKISIPNKCVCGGIVDSIPGWRCATCSKYENTLYCHDCYIKSKQLHKNHELYFCYGSRGMCDCGDPDSLYTYCHEHSGPLFEQKEIEEYINKSFDEKILKNLINFFDEFFVEFSKYFLLTAKCELFMEELFKDKFKGELSDELIEEKNDVEFIKSNFKIVFENLIYFLRLITKDNLGMVYLISNYFLKNNLDSLKLDEEYKIDHRCIEIKQDDIKIYYSNSNKIMHECKCPFFRHFLLNYRNNIKLKNEEDEKEFMFSFIHNLSSRYAFCILYFFLYNQILYNNNENVLYCITQFYLEDVHELIAKKTNFIENSSEIVYKFLLRIINKINKDNSLNKDEYLLYIVKYAFHLIEDIKYYSKPKIRKLMTDKTSYFKNIIDIISLFLNCNEYKSIVPHPKFQDKLVNRNLLLLEKYLIKVPGLLSCCINWTKIEQLKEIYKYIIYKILNQEKEGIKQLKENEYSYHLDLYRTFGILLNAFCFNYAFINKCTLLESVNYFKKNFFESQEQIEKLVEIILKNFCKFLGFICGVNNNFFNYYDNASIYFSIYSSELSLYQSDATLFKYLFALSEKKLDIISYLKQSNIENVSDLFNKVFNLVLNEDKNIIKNDIELAPENADKNKELKFTDILNMKASEEQKRRILSRFLLSYRNVNQDKSKDDLNIIMQWKLLFEFLLFFLKNDSSCYFNLINNYNNVISSETRNELFNKIKNNVYVMDDLKNILQEEIIHNMISQGNLIDEKNLEKNLDEYLLILFKKNNVYNETLNKLTYNKLNGETIMFYLKDEYLKFLDCNYFILPKNKSTAQKYILDFKKDIVKTYNYHFYNHSELTFEFYLNVYEKVLLNKNNLDLIFQILEKLKNNEQFTENLENKSIRNILLPIILNYLQMFNVINTKSFIEFKLENKKAINNLYQLLQNIIKNNSINNITDKDLEENIKDILNQMNRYQIIFDYYNGDLTKLNKFDYNANIIENQNMNFNIIKNDLMLNHGNSNNLSEGKKQSKNIKDKLKLLMKKKSNNFIKNIESNVDILKDINELNDLEINQDNAENEIMCFYCRNPIKLNSFEEPFGKLGLYIKDLFYINSLKASLRDEFSKLGLNDNNNKIYSEALRMIYDQKYFRITSCGHYFHNSCFVKGCKKKDDGPEFNCPLCLKYQNILIPPLTLFHDKYGFFKSEKINELFKDIDNKEQLNNNIEDKEQNEKLNLFNPTVMNFLISINLFKDNYKNYESFLENIYPYYKAYLTYFENIFYVEGSTFHKQQQIDNMKNFILSLRFFVNNSIEMSKFDIVKFIKNTFFMIVKGPGEEKFLYKYYDSYMHYLNLFEKIMFSLQILFDYEELKDTFKYILYIFLPYYLFGLYLKYLIIQKHIKILNEEQIIQKLNSNELNNYLKENNSQILEHLNSFMKKFCFIKLISDYQNKNEDLISNSFNQLNFKDILSIINMQDLLQFLPENNLNIFDIINQLPKIFSSNEILYNILSQDLNFDKILNSIFENINKYNTNLIYDITPELIMQFSPIKFNFIHLDNNIFDLIEKTITKKCIICGKTPKKAMLCLICGEKVCHSSRLGFNQDELLSHTSKCTGSYGMFIKLYKMKLFYINNKGRKKRLFPIYVNKNGIGAKGEEIGGEFNLSKEKLKLMLKNYLSNDFHFKN